MPWRKKCHHERSPGPRSVACQSIPPGLTCLGVTPVRLTQGSPSRHLPSSKAASPRGRGCEGSLQVRSCFLLPSDRVGVTTLFSKPALVTSIFIVFPTSTPTSRGGPELQFSPIFQLFHKRREEVPNFNFHQFFDFFISITRTSRTSIFTNFSTFS